MGTDKKYQPSYSHCYYVKATPSTSWPVTNTNSQDDKGNYEFWQAPQQISHTVCALWPFLVPHSEESVCVVWLPKCTNPKLQLGFKGQEKKDHWYRPYATFEESSQTKH